MAATIFGTMVRDIGIEESEHDRAVEEAEAQEGAGRGDDPGP
jgi:hypothetical protein